MITAERIEELRSDFWAETNEEETWEWRDELTPEEAALVEQWDERVEAEMLRLCEDILKTGNARKQKGNHDASTAAWHL